MIDIKYNRKFNLKDFFVNDPLGNDVVIRASIFNEKEHGYNLKTFVIACCLIQAPAYMIEGYSNDFYYFGSADNTAAIVIETYKVQNQWFANNPVKNPGPAYFKTVLKKGKLIKIKN